MQLGIYKYLCDYTRWLTTVVAECAGAAYLFMLLI